MEIIIRQDSQSASLLAARRIASCIRRKPEAVLGLATGGTPLQLYGELVRMHREEGLDFSGVRTFNLDEYLGLPPDHPASFQRFMRKNFFDHVNLRETHVPCGTVAAGDIEAACEAYESAIVAAGGIDIQVLGIGRDGHIGFNEPSSSLTSRTRIKTLTERTRLDNAASFASPGDVPHHVITMGIGTIMDAREVLLLAFGESKARAVAGAVEGPVTASNPASILQMHKTAKFCLDPAAARELARRDYYECVFERKPAWQRDDR